MECAFEWLPGGEAPPQLMILFHDRGADGDAMRPLAEALRGAFPDAALVAPQAPQASADGRSWVSGDDWDAAVAAALAGVRALQRRLVAGPAATALVGFGEGATLALETAQAADGIAGRVLAFGGSYRWVPQRALEHTTLHFLHGAADAVSSVALPRQALQHLGVLHGDATLDVADGVGHELHPSLIDSALFRLRSHIPHRTWRAAMGAVPGLAEAGGAACGDEEGGR